LYSITVIEFATCIENPALQAQLPLHLRCLLSNLPIRVVVVVVVVVVLDSHHPSFRNP